MGEVGELSNVYIVFDRSGRSEGVARAVFDSREAANSAIREFDGAELEGQIINLSIVANDQGRRNAGGKRLLAGGSFQVEARGGRKVITRCATCLPLIIFVCSGFSLRMVPLFCRETGVVVGLGGSVGGALGLSSTNKTIIMNTVCKVIDT